MNNSELNALLKLLSDTDDFVSGSARKKIISEFDNIKHRFNTAVKKAGDDLLISKATDITLEVSYIRTKKELINWKKAKDKNFIQGIFILSKFYDNDLKIESIATLFENIKQKINPDLENFSPIEKIKTLNFIFFKELKYKTIISQQTKKKEDYIFTKNIQRKNISSFLITFTYFAVAKQLNIPLYMILSKNILVLAYFFTPHNKNTQNIKSYNEFKYSFFVNVPNNGYMFTNEEFKYTLKKIKTKMLNDLVMLTPTNFVKLITENLIFIEKKNKNNIIVDYLLDFRKILES